jgi:hypothetical protein
MAATPRGHAASSTRRPHRFQTSGHGVALTEPRNPDVILLYSTNLLRRWHATGSGASAQPWVAEYRGAHDSENCPFPERQPRGYAGRL